MPSRPESDRELDEGVVRRALRAEFPEIEAGRVEHLGSGWAFDAWLVDRHRVVRFPRNAEIAGEVDRDAAILELVGEAIGSQVRVPEVTLRGRGGEHFPHPFLGYEWIPGIGADDPRAPDSAELISQLGQALTSIHSVPVSAATGIGLGREAWDHHTGPPRFLHGDFGPDNLVVDPGSGRLVGIIDWGNAAIGDPALDFVWLVLSRGWGFARSVLGEYGLPVEDDFVDRLRHHAQTRASEWLADTVRRGADPEVHLRWVRHAFSMEDDVSTPDVRREAYEQP